MPAQRQEGQPRGKAAVLGVGLPVPAVPTGKPCLPCTPAGLEPEMFSGRPPVKGSRLPEPSTSQHVLFLDHPHDPHSRLALAGDLCAGTVSPHSLGLRSSESAPRRTSLGRSGPGGL